MTTIWIDAHFSTAIATWITDAFGGLLGYEMLKIWKSLRLQKLKELSYEMSFSKWIKKGSYHQPTR